MTKKTLSKSAVSWNLLFRILKENQAPAFQMAKNVVNYTPLSSDNWQSYIFINFSQSISLIIEKNSIQSTSKLSLVFEEIKVIVGTTADHFIIGEKGATMEE